MTDPIKLTEIFTNNPVTELDENDIFLVTINPDTTPKSGGIERGNLFKHGTYTPTLTNVTNIASSSVNAPFFYFTIGPFVFVTGSLLIDPTTATPATTSQADFTLPFASDFTDIADLNGQGGQSGAVSQTGVVIANTANDRASLVFLATDASARSWRVWAMYIVK